MNFKTSKNNKPLVVITGAGSGIGACTVHSFINQGWHVVAVSKNQDKLEKLSDNITEKFSKESTDSIDTNIPITLAPLDLRDSDGIERLSQAIEQRWGYLDAIVGNAGILGSLTPIVDIDDKSWNEVMEINLKANWHLLRNFTHLLRKSPHPRTLFMTSSVGYKPRAYWSAYAISKAALESMVAMYAKENELHGIKANLLNPGAVATGMRAQAMPGEDPSTITPPSKIAAAIFNLCQPDIQFSGYRVNYPDMGKTLIGE